MQTNGFSLIRFEKLTFRLPSIRVPLLQVSLVRCAQSLYLIATSHIKVTYEITFKLRTMCPPCLRGSLTGAFQRSRAVVSPSATSPAFSEPFNELVAVSQCFINNYVIHYPAHCDVCSAIRFVNMKNIRAAEIHRQLVELCGKVSKMMSVLVSDAVCFTGEAQTCTRKRNLVPVCHRRIWKTGQINVRIGENRRFAICCAFMKFSLM
jgi:hypothetical protein